MSGRNGFSVPHIQLQVQSKRQRQLIRAQDNFKVCHDNSRISANAVIFDENFEHTSPAFTCSYSATGTPDKRVQCSGLINNRGDRTTSLMSF